MTKPMSRAERKAAYLKQSDQLFEEMEDWYDDHPLATFEEIEGQARISRRKLMGVALEIFVNGRDTGKQAFRPLCPDCNSSMNYKGYSERTIYGIEGDTKLKRAYYHCPNKCENGRFFPSG